MKTSESNGYYSIGVYQGKTEHNIGTLWRSAYILGASYIFTIEKKYKKQSSDVIRTWARIPLFHHKTFDDFMNHIPYDCRLVAIEIDENAEDLSTFIHPKRAIYLLGSENNGLPKSVLDKCHYIVRLKGNSSLNVGVTGGIVLHDRCSKMPSVLPPAHI
jgi:tRNA G18 (ribose-2'-O)-methylase SpoU